MSVSERAKVIAGRWADRYLPPSELPAELPMPSVPVFPDIPFSTPRAARTLMQGDEIHVGGEWVQIVARPQPFVLRDEWTGQAAPCMRLVLPERLVLEPRYEALLLSRDAEEQALAAGGSDGC